MSNGPDDRVMRLEESMLFAERRVEELAEQLLALSGRVETLTRRVGSLEAMLGRLTSDESDAPGVPGPDAT